MDWRAVAVFAVGATLGFLKEPLKIPWAIVAALGFIALYIIL